MVLRSRTQAGRWRGSLAPIRAPCSLEEIHELVLSVNIYALGAGREATAMMLGGVTGGRLPGEGTKLALTKVNGGGHSMTTVPRLEHVVHAGRVFMPPGWSMLYMQAGGVGPPSQCMLYMQAEGI